MARKILALASASLTKASGCGAVQGRKGQAGEAVLCFLDAYQSCGFPIAPLCRGVDVFLVQGELCPSHGDSRARGALISAGISQPGVQSAAWSPAPAGAQFVLRVTRPWLWDLKT